MSANYVLLQTVNVGSVQPSSINFTNIPSSGYTDLVIKGSTRDTGVNGAIVWTFNGDGTNGNYVAKRVQTQGTAASSDTVTRYVAQNGTNETGSTFTSWEMYIPNYVAATNHTFMIDSVVETNGSTLNNESSALTAAYWTGGAAINSISFTTNAAFAENSVITLYAVSALGSDPVIGPKATGGDVIKTDGTYWYHAFRSSGTFTPTQSITADALVIAGGGGGGHGATGYTNRAAGGGGAGGLLLHSSQSLTAQTYAITVGSGGAGGISSSNTLPVAGSNSQLASLTASVGGGFGGSPGVTNASAGGSGGGAADNNGPGTATSGQGFAGGIGFDPGSGTTYSGGGGGGSGAAGSAGSAGSGGLGGVGLTTYTSWGSATNSGTLVSSDYVYSIGGRGGGTSPGTPNGGTGASNTGNGGGGSYTVNNGGAGGSGIVIIRYAIA